MNKDQIEYIAALIAFLLPWYVAAKAYYIFKTHHFLSPQGLSQRTLRGTYPGITIFITWPPGQTINSQIIPGSLLLPALIGSRFLISPNHTTLFMIG